MNWKGKRVVIVGAGRQGFSLAEHLVRNGADVIVTDIKPKYDLGDFGTKFENLPLMYTFGSHPLEILDDVDLLFVSGGVPITIPFILEAEKRGVPFSNDSQLFLEETPALTIGITGSAGKTTTAALLGHVLSRIIPRTDDLFRKVWVGGNIGNPLLNDVSEMNERDIAVMELSSFQLEIMENSSDIAVILNLYPDHLDRHLTMESYIDAKSRILINQTSNSTSILNRDDPRVMELTSLVRGKMKTFGLSPLSDDSEGIYLNENQIISRQYLNGQYIDKAFANIKSFPLRGDHNLLNLLAVSAIIDELGLPLENLETSLTDFKGIPHRLELIRKWKGAEWINDSIATTPDRASAGIRSIEGSIILLAGGRDKDLDWNQFADLVISSVVHLILFGEAQDLINSVIERRRSLYKSETPNLLTISKCDSLKNAVIKARELVSPGFTVLLSPGGTSFDEFENYEERGKCFKQLVRKLQ